MVGLPCLHLCIYLPQGIFSKVRGGGGGSALQRRSDPHSTSSHRPPRACCFSARMWFSVCAGVCCHLKKLPEKPVRVLGTRGVLSSQRNRTCATFLWCLPAPIAPAPWHCPRFLSCARGVWCSEFTHNIGRGIVSTYTWCSFKKTGSVSKMRCCKT